MLDPCMIGKGHHNICINVITSLLVYNIQSRYSPPFTLTLSTLSSSSPLALHHPPTLHHPVRPFLLYMTHGAPVSGRPASTRRQSPAHFRPATSPFWTRRSPLDLPAPALAMLIVTSSPTHTLTPNSPSSPGRRLGEVPETAARGGGWGDAGAGAEDVFN